MITKNPKNTRPEWLRDGVRVWYRSYPGAQACMGTVDGDPWMLGGHTLVADLREMDHVYQDAHKRAHVNAAAVFALAPMDTENTR